jgi:hypothetical protein
MKMNEMRAVLTLMLFQPLLLELCMYAYLGQWNIEVDSHQHILSSKVDSFGQAFHIELGQVDDGRRMKETTTSSDSSVSGNERQHD